MSLRNKTTRKYEKIEISNLPKKKIKRPKKTENDETDNRILEGLAKGNDIKQIAEITALNPSTIYSRIERMRKLGIVIPNKKEEIDNRILEGLAEGKTQTEIAKELGLNSATISIRIKKMKERGLEIPNVTKKKIERPKKTENDEIDNRILEGLAEGKTQTEIAKELGITVTPISIRIKKMKERGLEIPKAKIDIIDDKILEGLSEGKNHTEIAKELSLSHTAINLRVKKMKERGLEIPNVTKKKIENDEINKKILEGLEEGKTQTEIAKEVNLSRQAVSQRIKQMKELGIKIPKAKIDIIDDKILEGLAKGKTQTEIAKELGITVTPISIRIKKMKERGIDIPNVQKRKIERPKKIENDEIDKKILEGLAEGKTQTEIAKEVNLSKQAVSKRIKQMKELGIVIPNKKEIIDKKILEELAERKTQTEIAKELGANNTTISRRIKKMKERGIEIPNVQKKKGRPHKAESEAINKKILEGLAKGNDIKQIAEITALNPRTIYSRIERMRKIGIEIPNKKEEIDNRILEGLAEGKTQTEIAKEVNLSKQAVSKRIKQMKELGIVIPNKKEEIDNRILEGLAKGNDIKQIAEITALNPSTIYSRIERMRKLGIVILNKKEEIDNRILEELAEGKTQTEIAKELGLNSATISIRIKKMKERGLEIPNVTKKKIENDEIDKKIRKGLDERDNKKLANMIVNLIITKNATIEQIKIMGAYYGVNVEEILNSLEEKER